jgi:hypothetical protein
VTLEQPIAAVACGERVQIVDASLRGVRLAHSTLLSERRSCPVAFTWEGKEIEFVGQLKWTKLQRGKNMYLSGVQIERIDPFSTTALRNLIQACVERALRDQKENAQGIPPAAETPSRTRRPPLYARHELLHGIWRKTMTHDPQQPDSGFTVPVDESAQQIELLRAAYAVADRPLQDMIRRLAELSITTPEEALTRRYTP